jgi:hypothetical protein
MERKREALGAGRFLVIRPQPAGSPTVCDSNTS